MTRIFSHFTNGRRITIAALASACLYVLAACSTYNSATQQVAKRISPYQITIVQGNFVSRQAAARLQAGMSREQVRQILGTPLLTDIFHTNRWDYIFSFQRGTKSVIQPRCLVVEFKGDRLVRWHGADHLPTEHELLSTIDGDRNHAK